MYELSDLERAVLHAIALQAQGSAAALEHQINGARVLARENTGAGFFTTLSVAPGCLLEGIRSPVGDAGATVVGLKHGMGFMLWIKDGLIHQLEGYAYGNEDTSGINFQDVEFRNLQAR